MPGMAIGERDCGWVTIAANKPDRYHWTVAGFLVVVGLPLGLWSGSIELLIAAATALICVLVLARIGRACSVTVTEKDVQHRGILGRRRHIPREDIATVLYAPHLDLGKSQCADWLVLLDARDRPLLRLTSLNIWPEKEIERVCAAVGRPTVYMRDTQAPVVRLRYPKVMPYRTANPNVAGGIATVIIFGVVAIGVSLAAALSS